MTTVRTFADKSAATIHIKSTTGSRWQAVVQEELREGIGS